MSVSFPGAVQRGTAVGARRAGRREVFRRCLFSDGGVCSNFPIHLFDSAIPSWPTFGISLHEIPASNADPESGVASDRRKRGRSVCLPESQLERAKDQWNEFESEPAAVERLSGFFGALLSTTKDWNDATLARLPGVRDRVVQVGLHPGIGGLNILMTGEADQGPGRTGGEAGLQAAGAVCLARRAAERRRPMAGTSIAGCGFNVLRDSLSQSLAGLTWAAVAGLATASRFATRSARRSTNRRCGQNAGSQLLQPHRRPRWKARWPR